MENLLVLKYQNLDFGFTGKQNLDLPEKQTNFVFSCQKTERIGLVR